MTEPASSPFTSSRTAPSAPRARLALDGAGALRAFLVSTLLVAATLAFSYVINIGSFRQGYANTLMAAYSAVGNKAADNIREALGYGKPLDDFFGLDAILRRVRDNVPSARSVAVAMTDGRIVHTDTGPAQGTMAEATRRRVASELARRPYWFQYDAAVGRYTLYVPVPKPERDGIAGYLLITSNAAPIDHEVEGFRERIAALLVWTGGGTVALLALFALGTVPLRSRPGWMDRAHRATALGLLVAAQIVSGADCFALLRAAHVEAAEQATGIVATLVRNDIESVIRRGIDYRALNGLDAYFDELRAELPYLRAIGLSTELGASDTPPSGDRTLVAPDDRTLRWMLEPDRTGMAPTLAMTISGTAIAGQLSEFALDMATILVTSLLFMFELSRASGRKAGSVAEAGAPVPGAVTAVRFMAFLLYFGAFLPVSFVPLMMGTFERELFGLTPVQAAAAPLTMEMLCGIAALLLAGRLGARVGWRVVTLLGFLLAGVGLLLSAQAADPLVFVLSRGLAGAGTMGALMGITIAVGRMRGSSDGSALQAGLFAGMYAGVNCGAVSGSLMAATQGTATVFLAGGAVLAGGLLFVTLGVSSSLAAPAEAPAAPSVAPESGATGTGATARKEPVGGYIAAFLLLVSLPTAVAGMFQPFYLPLFVAQLGQSTATVGRAYLLHGLCIVLLGPWLTRLTARVMAPVWAVLLSGAGLAAALLLFGIQPSLTTAFLAVLLIGVAESFGLSAQVRQAEWLIGQTSRRRESVLALHVNTRKLGQAAGPLAFGAVIAGGPLGVAMLAAGLGSILLLYAVLPRPAKRSGAVQDGVAGEGAG